MYSEFELIERISAAFDRPSGVPLGIGDDCAVLTPERFDLVTTDTLVEGVHFRRDWSTAEEIGWKALAVSLSDVAAMGGAPGAFLMNLTVAPEVEAAFVDGLIAGISQAIDELVPPEFAVAPAGGDVTRTTGPTVITTTLFGVAPGPGPVMRGGAVRGDHLVMLGPLGLAQAGVDLLEGAVSADPEDFPRLVEAHRRPRPLVNEGGLLGEHAIPSALIDTSDGFGSDLGHILDRSHAGAQVDVSRFSIHDELAAFCEEVGRDPLDYVLSGGEDFQLCMAVPDERIDRLDELADEQGWPVYRIGEILSATDGLSLVDADGTPVEVDTLGYEHFTESGRDTTGP